jgi:choline dehydrogenase-like flavoprotein
LYWSQERVIGGDDPIELGKNNSGRGVGGSMIHYAGYCPRFHRSDFEVKARDGVGADWPISYSDLKAHYEQVERELPVAGQDRPCGDPHQYPFSPHPIGGAAAVL